MTANTPIRKTVHKMGVFQSTCSFFFCDPSVTETTVNSYSMLPVEEWLQNSTTPGIFVLYGAGACGKTHAVKHFAKKRIHLGFTSREFSYANRAWWWPFYSNKSNEEFQRNKDDKVVLFWEDYQPATDAKISITKFVRRMGFMKTHFFTVVLDDFDQHMHRDRDKALDFLRELLNESVVHGVFNLLVVCSESNTAFQLLDVCAGYARHAVVHWNVRDATALVDNVLAKEMDETIDQRTRQIAIDHLVATGDVDAARGVLMHRALEAWPGHLLDRKVHQRIRTRVDDILEVFKATKGSYFQDTEL